MYLIFLRLGTKASCLALLVSAMPSSGPKSLLPHPLVAHSKPQAPSITRRRRLCTAWMSPLVPLSSSPSSTLRAASGPWWQVGGGGVCVCGGGGTAWQQGNTPDGWAGVATLRLEGGRLGTWPPSCIFLAPVHPFAPPHCVAGWLQLQQQQLLLLLTVEPVHPLPHPYALFLHPQRHLTQSCAPPICPPTHQCTQK